jgi:subtilisin-like proprotein convertase family protein
MQPNDPLYSQQWHFSRLGNIEKIWDQFSGAGIHVGVYDTGIELTHLDLAGNYDPSRNLVFNSVTVSGAPNPAGQPDSRARGHGTAVAGIIGAALNGEGVVGVAWGAALTSINIDDSTTPYDLSTGNTLDFAEVIRWGIGRFDVTNNSWNTLPAYDPNANVNQPSGFATVNEAFADVCALGRNGLGTIIVQGIGNNNLDAQGTGLNGSRFTITVAGFGSDGFAADYSNYGACVLVTAPTRSTVTSPDGVVTTDLIGTDGYNGTAPDGYTNEFGGTSSTGPMVAGVVALMLDANPGLGWRDVQNILAASAHHTGSAIGAVSPGTNESSNWFLNEAANWNGGSMHFSNDYGYGAVDAFSAARMAEVWSLFTPAAQTTTNELIWNNFDDTDYAIPDGSALQTSVLLTPIPAIDLEHVDVRLTLTHSDYRQLRIFLIAPSGTEVQLYDGSAANASVADVADGELTWTYGAEAFRGEDAAGTWTLRIEDTAAGETGTLSRFQVIVHGALASTNDVYHYTDEFLAMAALTGESGRALLTDLNGGTDWIDAAAVTGNVGLNLATGATVNGANWFTVVGVIENAATGDGNDTLTGTGFDNILWGGRGDDTAVFSQNFASYMAQDLGLWITVSGPDGSDTLHRIEHLQFADGTVDVNDGNLLFDTLFYLAQNPDVFQADVNALNHYGTFGRHEGRDPNAFFDTSGYLGANKDVAAAGMDPLDHYHAFGWIEGRDPSAGFDTTLYLINNPDVAAAHIDPLAHYLASGLAEGRAAYAAIGRSILGGFDAEYYLFHNPDVAAAGIDPLLHYSVAGWHEGRNPNAWLDTAGYLSHYTDVAAAGINPLQHYALVGWTEGRDPSAGFDTLGYLAANPDVAAAHIDPLDHFLRFGIYEGRTAINDGVFA